jgi:hypothetical protein
MLKGSVGMKTRVLYLDLISLLLVLSIFGYAAANPPSRSVSVDADLRRLEEAKWHPSSLGSSERFATLFADDFVTVEYGADIHGAVYRKLNAKASMSSSEFAKLLQLLDQTQFSLSDRHFIHIGSDGVVVSYHVTAPALDWNAYAISVWAKRGGRWQTVMYQASIAK